jgi:hypothetical protein
MLENVKKRETKIKSEPVSFKNKKGMYSFRKVSALTAGGTVNHPNESM